VSRAVSEVCGFVRMTFTGVLRSP